MPVYHPVLKSHSTRTKIINDIHQERARQDHLHPDKMSVTQRLPVLIEEIGEVGTALQNNDKENLYQELIQVAAVAVRMAEQLIEEDNS